MVFFYPDASPAGKATKYDAHSERSSGPEVQETRKEDTEGRQETARTEEGGGLGEYSSIQEAKVGAIAVVGIFATYISAQVFECYQVALQKKTISKRKKKMIVDVQEVASSLWRFITLRNSTARVGRDHPYAVAVRASRLAANHPSISPLDWVPRRWFRRKAAAVEGGTLRVEDMLNPLYHQKKSGAQGFYRNRSYEERLGATREFLLDSVASYAQWNKKQDVIRNYKKHYLDQDTGVLHVSLADDTYSKIENGSPGISVAPFTRESTKSSFESCVQTERNLDPLVKDLVRLKVSKTLQEKFYSNQKN